MKKLLIIAFSLFVTSVFAQSINPKQYAIIDAEMITGKASEITPGITNESTVFTPDGHYLFISNIYADSEGKLLVYSTKIKDVVKAFKIRKTGIYGSYGKVICNANNTKQLALAINKSEVRVMQNWETAPEDVLLKKPSESSIAVKVEVDKGQMAFSKDGKSLYVIQNESKIIEVVDLATGKITKRPLPDKKVPCIKSDISTFIGGDEILVYNESTKTTPHFIEIFDLASNQFVRKYALEGIFDFPTGSSKGNPHIIRANVGDLTMNLLTGEVNKTYKKIIETLKGEKTYITIDQLPNKAYVVNYFYVDKTERTTSTSTITTTETKKGLFFFDSNGNMVAGDFPKVNSKIPNTLPSSYQISPNGKFILFDHKAGKWENFLVLATLY